MFQEVEVVKDEESTKLIVYLEAEVPPANNTNALLVIGIGKLLLCCFFKCA